MPTLTLKSGVQFFYTDSGTVTAKDYTTLILIHGHTYHAGTFQRLSPLAERNALRIISVNRREYPGSSPYCAEDLKVFQEGTDAERAVLLEQQGYDLACFVDGIIHELGVLLPGGIMLVGWSLGTIFLLSLIACIENLPGEMKDRLSEFVHTVVLLRSLIPEPPSLALGVPRPPGRLIPHTDPDITPEARGPEFAKWVSSYFLHGDLSDHKIEQLTYRNTDPLKRPTIEILDPDDFLAITDFAPAEKYDNIVGLHPFESLVAKQTAKALFDPEPWNIIHAAWCLEEQCRTVNTPEVDIHFKAIDGGNHFFVWEEPERAIQVLKECLPF
ncbi:hypothetical protein C8J57DRAFT_1256057 [Mycena rebaudengoi]|nr:hypothetical protein C8J57DRAFT_1256057 [Mycena rebaudengoi]